MALIFTKLNQNVLANRDEAKKYVEEIIWKVAFQNVKEQQGWAESVGDSAQGIVYLAMGNKLPQPQLASEETIAKEKSLFDAKFKNQYDSKVNCFYKATETGLKEALRENESVVQEWFTYLEAPFKAFPTSTPVFVRRTNLAEYCLIITGYLVRRCTVGKQDPKRAVGELIYYEAPGEGLGMLQGHGRGIISIAGSLAGALLKGILDKFGALIIEEVFPSGVPSYFDEVYKEIEKIVREELTQNTISEINGQINGMKNWVATTYAHAKESGVMSNEELTDLIQPREPEITVQLIGVLMDQRFAKAGLCVFMIGAGMRLAILQELAYVDPNVDSPSDSSYVETIKTVAREYAEHAKATFEAIVRIRLEMIYPEYVYRYFDGTRYYWYKLKDSFTGYNEEWYKYCDTKGCHNTDAEDKRDHAMAERKEAIRNDLVEKMGDPIATANEWLKLINQPLPSEN